MARWHLRDDDNGSLGAGGITLLTVGLLAGLAAGAYMAHRLGGVSGISARVRRRWRTRPPLGRPEGVRHSGSPPDEDDDAYAAAYHSAYAADYDAVYDLDDDAAYADERAEDVDEDDADDEIGDFTSADPDLEDRVLEAFMNDPILRQRAVDIGAITAGTIELTGSVHTDEEFERAATLAGGVPGVRSVVNRVTVLEEDDEEYDDDDDEDLDEEEEDEEDDDDVLSEVDIDAEGDEDVAGDHADDVVVRRGRRPAGGRVTEAPNAPTAPPVADRPTNPEPPRE